MLWSVIIYILGVFICFGILDFFDDSDQEAGDKIMGGFLWPIIVIFYISVAPFWLIQKGIKKLKESLKDD